MLVWMYQTTWRHRSHSFQDRNSIKTFLTVLTSGLKRVGTCNCIHHKQINPSKHSGNNMYHLLRHKKYPFYLRGICVFCGSENKQRLFPYTALTDWIFIYNSTFCPHSVFMCFVWIWEQTAIISLYSINWLVFIIETECVYCAVRPGSLYIILRSAHTVYLCVLCGSENKQRLFPYTALSNWFL